MEKYMSSILLKVFLAGEISGPVESVDIQKSTVDVSKIGSKHPDWVTKKICHTDRVSVPCHRKMIIDSDIVDGWANSDCPRWEKPTVWKTKTPQQKIESHLSQYDEGFGISYEYLENS